MEKSQFGTKYTYPAINFSQICLIYSMEKSQFGTKYIYIAINSPQICFIYSMEKSQFGTKYIYIAVKFSDLLYTSFNQSSLTDKPAWPRQA
jgi:hypothetical protein